MHDLIVALLWVLVESFHMHKTHTAIVRFAFHFCFDILRLSLS